MKISSTKEFHSVVSSFKSLLERRSVSIKTTRAQELLAETLGFKSANGLIASVPLDVTLTETMYATLRLLLKERHQVNDIDSKWVLDSLEQNHKSYSSAWNSDLRCYPRKISPSENYWYLMNDGWYPWEEMNFEHMAVELNIYKVVHSHFMPFLGSDSFSGTARPIWTADIGSHEFEAEASKLERKFGEMPNHDLMFSIRNT